MLATLDSFKNQIAWERLPKTLQVAVSFTCRLGINYLQIDSLCIAQDSISDWKHEGAHMEDIYESACVTLAASEGSGPYHGGCSPASKVHTSWPILVEPRTAGEIEEEAIIHAQKPLAHSENRYSLLERGWGLQERVPEVLGFRLWRCHIFCS